MRDKILALRNFAQTELSRRTKGTTTSFPVYAFLLYPSTSLHFASVIERGVIRKTIDSVTGDDILFIVVEPLEYRSEFINVPNMMFGHISVPANEPAEFYSELTGRNYTHQPLFLFMPNLPLLVDQRGQFLQNSPDESVIIVSLDGENTDQYVARLEEILKFAARAIESVESIVGNRNEMIYSALEKQLAKYRRGQIIRKSATFIRKVLDLVGLIPGL